MLSIQELSDKQEIEDLFHDYSHAVDTLRLDELDKIFTPDAFIDYTAMGGAKGNLAEIKSYLARALPTFKSCQHMTGSRRIRVSGDTATARSIVFNPMVLERGGVEEVAFFGLWYHDTFVRTPEGWRFSSRVEERSYAHNLPRWFEYPDLEQRV
jgi:hypothetical protein